MKYFSVLMLFISVLTGKGIAQTNGYYVGLGGNFLKLTELNNELGSVGIGSSGIPKTNITLGVFHQADRAFYGAELSALTQVIPNSIAIGQTTQAYTRFYQLMPRFGYAPVTFDDIYYFYPAIGIGGGVGTVRRVDNSVSPAEIRSSSVFGGSLEGSLNMTIITPIPGDKGSNVVIGAGGGYLYNPLFGKSWKSDDIISGKTIPVRPGGFFFRLSIGMANER
ncbi:MAG: hypothetical protein K1X92_08090 [Bacteroidia bacterium]|nr:hypothetical protein [Bacteroidia bacterium]